MDSKKILSALALVFLIAGGVSLYSFPLPKASAASYPSVCRANTGSGAQTFEQSFDTSHFQEPLAVAFNTHGCAVAGTLVIVSIWYAIPLGDPALSNLQIFDNSSSAFYHFDSAQGMYSCRAAVNTRTGTCGSALYAVYLEIYSIALTKTVGHISLTVQTPTSAFPYNGIFAGSFMFVNGLANTTAQASCIFGGYYTLAGNGYNQGFPVSASFGCSVQMPSYGFAYNFLIDTNNAANNAVFNEFLGTQYTEVGNAVAVDSNHCTDNGGALCGFQTGVMLNGGHQSSAGGQFACMNLCAGVSYVDIFLSFGPACTPPPCTSSGGTGTPPNPGPTNTSCNPACPNGGPGTSGTVCTTVTCISHNGNDYLAGNYTQSNELFYYVAQNTAGGGGTIYNFTTKIAQTHCQKATCYLFQAIYVPSTPTSPPSSSNKLQLYSPVTIFAMTNATKNIGLSSQMSIPIPPNYYWADAIVSNSTASGGASGSGVSVYTASWNATMSYYQASALMPLSFIGQVATSYPFYFRAAMVTGLAAVTSTTSSVTTLSVSTTFTTSTVSNVINGPNQNQSGPGFIIPMMFVMIPFTLFALIGLTLKRFGSR